MLVISPILYFFILTKALGSLEVTLFAFLVHFQSFNIFHFDLIIQIVKNLLFLIVYLFNIYHSMIKYFILFENDFLKMRFFHCLVEEDLFYLLLFIILRLNFIILELKFRPLIVPVILNNNLLN